MVKLSNSLMDLAKASYDPNEISFSEVRLDEVLLESYTQITKENTNYKVSLNIENTVEEHQLIIQSNEYLLRVAFNNLIDNACKYSPEHSCFIDVKNSAQNLMISFTNTGNKIPDEDLQHIFKPFYRSETSSREKGHGIGLFLTGKIIQLHRMKITVTTIHQKIVFTVIFKIN